MFCCVRAGVSRPLKEGGNHATTCSNILNNKGVGLINVLEEEELSSNNSSAFSLLSLESCNQWLVSEGRAKEGWGSGFNFCERALLALLSDMTVTTASSSLTDPSLNTEWQCAKLKKCSHSSSGSACAQSFTFLIRQILHLPILIIFSNFVCSFLLVISLHFNVLLCKRNIHPDFRGSAAFSPRHS